MSDWNTSDDEALQALKNRLDDEARSAPGSQTYNPYAPPPENAGVPDTFWDDPDRVLASRVTRLGAHFLDATILFSPPILGFLLFDVLAYGLFLVIVINCYLITVSGQSIAKRIVGIQIVRSDGTPIGFVRGVLLRGVLPWLLSVCTYGLFGLIDALWIFGGQRRCFHDLFADSIVVVA